MDFAGQGWTLAFENLNKTLSREYPFTEWKAIEWDVLYATFAPRIAAAQAAHDYEGYYLALREYVYSIPDGHVSVGGGMTRWFRRQAVGGGYGLGVIQLDDGRVIAHVILEEGPAEAAGIEWGAEIIAWNGVPVETALAQTSTLWAEVPPATAEGRRLQQCRFVVRAPVGTAADVTFRSPGEGGLETIALEAEDDDYKTLVRTDFLEGDASLFFPPLVSRILPEGYGHIRLLVGMPTVATPFPAEKFRRIIRRFLRWDVPGIILDVRRNPGGADVIVPAMMGHFYTERSFYEAVGCYDPDLGALEVSPGSELYIEPREPHFGGPVVILVDAGTLSSGEGIAMAAQGMPQGAVVGFYGTYGSFGIGGATVCMPGLCFVGFPEGASLDSQGRVQLDSDPHGIGGVVPDVRVPLTEETVYAEFVDEVDVALQTAVEALDAALGSSTRR